MTYASEGFNISTSIMADCEICPIFEGRQWGIIGDCGLVSEPGGDRKVIAADTSCRPEDQQDFVDLHITIKIVDPKIQLVTEGPLRPQCNTDRELAERARSSSCPLANPGTCDIARKARAGICQGTIYPPLNPVVIY